MAILKHKKLTSKRGISLNKDICAFVGLQPGDPVDVTAQDDGTVLIRKHSPRCRFCGDNVKAVSIMGIDICPNCAALIAKDMAIRKAVTSVD